MNIYSIYLPSPFGTSAKVSKVLWELPNAPLSIFPVLKLFFYHTPTINPGQACLQPSTVLGQAVKDTCPMAEQRNVPLSILRTEQCTGEIRGNNSFRFIYYNWFLGEIARQSIMAEDDQKDSIFGVKGQKRFMWKRAVGQNYRAGWHERQQPLGAINW